MGSDPVPFYANLFLVHKKTEWVKAQDKLGTIDSFQFIDDLLSQNDDCNNSCASFLDMYIYIENREFDTKLFDKQDNFGFDIVRSHFTAWISLVKRSMAASAELLNIANQLRKLGGGRGGVEPPTKFSQRWGLTGTRFLQFFNKK